MSNTLLLKQVLSHWWLTSGLQKGASIRWFYRKVVMNPSAIPFWIHVVKANVKGKMSAILTDTNGRKLNMLIPV